MNYAWSKYTDRPAHGQKPNSTLVREKLTFPESKTPLPFLGSPGLLTIILSSLAVALSDPSMLIPRGKGLSSKPRFPWTIIHARKFCVAHFEGVSHSSKRLEMNSHKPTLLGLLWPVGNSPWLLLSLDDLISPLWYPASEHSHFFKFLKQKGSAPLAYLKLPSSLTERIPKLVKAPTTHSLRHTIMAI